MKNTIQQVGTVAVDSGSELAYRWRVDGQKNTSVRLNGMQSIYGTATFTPTVTLTTSDTPTPTSTRAAAATGTRSRTGSNGILA